MDIQLDRREVLKKGVSALAIAAFAGDAVISRASPGAGSKSGHCDCPGSIPNDQIREACEKTAIFIEGVVDSIHWRATLSHNNPKMRNAKTGRGDREGSIFIG